MNDTTARSAPIARLRHVASETAHKTRLAARQWIAKAWIRLHNGEAWLRSIWSRHGIWGLLLTGAVLLAVSALSAPHLQAWLSRALADQAALDGLKTVLLTVGGAMIGATAFAFSLVMFAMQVNVERMPHGLFRKLSSDSGLLAAFSASFLAALAIAVSPLFLTKDTITLVLLADVWAAILVFVLFLAAYRRALRLISPSAQLQIVVRTAQRDMERWRRLASRSAASFEPDSDPSEDGRGPKRDLSLTAFFQLYPHWTARTEQSLAYAVSFSRRYAEHGDHEVSAIALNAILAINATYVRVKGATFFSQHLLFDNPLVTDGFINATLEHLRQNVRIEIARGDERAIGQNLRAIARLTEIYLAINYGDDHQPKTHAYIAGGFLSEAIQSIAPHNYPDLLMDGVRLLGGLARAFIGAAQITDMTAFGGYLSTIGAAGVARADHRPVLQAAMDELAKLTFHLLRAQDQDVGHALDEIKNHVTLLATLTLKATPDEQFGAGHSSSLGPYYSGKTRQALLSWLHDLVNALIDAKEDDEGARALLDNVERFSEKLYRSERDLLLKAVENKSSFTFDIVHWIKSVSILLWAASNADACDPDTSEELQKHGLWLVSALSWVPDDKSAVEVIDRNRLADTLFELAFEAHRRAEQPVADRVNTLQLSWALKAAAFGAHWGDVDTAMCGLSLMALWRGDAPTLPATIHAAIERAEHKPDAELLDHVARELRRRAGRLWEERHGYTAVRSALAEADHALLAPIVRAVADVLSPASGNGDDNED